MRALILLIAILSATACVLIPNHRLITASGTHFTQEKKTSLEVHEIDATHVGFRVEYTQTEARGDGTLLETTRSVGGDEPFPVAAKKWAFWLSDSTVWLFDGDESLSRFDLTHDGIRISGRCSDPEIASQAPKELRKWIEAKGRTSR